MNKPNVFIIGTAKAGTTWLYECLKEHPEVNVSPTGEVDYFSYYYKKGEKWYLNHFKSPSPTKICIDVTPSYLTDSNTPELMFKFNPNAKIVLVVRNPIDRAYSHYCMHFRVGNVSARINDELNENSRYLQDGLYFKYIKAFERWFPREQIIILNFDDLSVNPRSYFSLVCKKLSIDPQFKPTLLDGKYHSRKGKPKRQNLYKLLVNGYRFFAKKAVFKKITFLLDRFRKSKYVDVVHHIVKSDENFPELTSKKRNELKDWFRGDLEKFEQWAGLDLSHWVEK